MKPRHDCEPNTCHDPSDDGKCFRSLEFGKLLPTDCDKWGPVFLKRSQHHPSIEERAGVQNGAVLHSSCGDRTKLITLDYV